MSAPSALDIDGLRPVSSRLVAARLLGGAPGHLVLVALAVAGVVAAVREHWWWPWPIAAVAVIVVLQSLLLTARRVRAIGYLDREEDLVMARGLLVRSMTVTPYGRVQSVEVSEGPIERRLGIATLALRTASAVADVSLPGLPREEAERLRVLLTSRGVERMQSL